jgi:hypothetical protein
VERRLFFKWVQCPGQGVTSPFTGPDSPGLDKLDQLAFKHAERYEFEFMSQIEKDLEKEDFASHIAGMEFHLALVKSMGLWLWEKALYASYSEFLEPITRFACIAKLINISYNANIPIIWGMATEKLTSTTQMTFLGLRIIEDDSLFAPMPSVLNNGDVSYFIECDVVDAKLGRTSLMLDYDKVGKSRRDWIRQNIKDGLKRIIDNAVDISIEIGKKLNCCDCGADNTIIEGLTKLAVSQAGEKAPAGRLAFRRFAKSHRLKPGDMPPDMFELPLIFWEGYQDLVSPETFQMCNYLGYWWNQECDHSPPDSDIRAVESRFLEWEEDEDLPPLDKLFKYLERDWVTDGTHKTIREWSRGKTMGQIVNKVRTILKRESLFNTYDIAKLQKSWPLSNSWNAEHDLK